MDYRVINGDCADVLPEYAGMVNLVVTLPPYGQLREYGGHGFDFERMAGPRASRPAACWFGWLPTRRLTATNPGEPYRQVLAFKAFGLKLHDTMIYAKIGSNGMTNPGRHQSGFEFMFVFSRGKPGTVNIIADIPTSQSGRTKQKPTHRQADGSLLESNPYRIPDLTQRNNIWHYDPGYNKAHPGFPAAHEHPATYPYALAADHIRTWSEPGDLVLDPMAGSGTTLRAAVDLGRRAVGIEIHTPYCELIERRMAQRVLDLSTVVYNSR